jgi:hypothetical protein
VVNTDDAPSVEEGDVNATSSEAKSAKLAKLLMEKPIKAAKESSWSYHMVVYSRVPAKVALISDQNDQ